MIGTCGTCGSCKWFEEPKLLTGNCKKHKKETAIFGGCEDHEPKIIHENEVLKKMRETE